MDVTVIRCPATGKILGTGVEALGAHFVGLEQLVFWIKCPYCNSDHPWDYDYAWFCSEIETGESRRVLPERLDLEAAQKR